MRIPEPRELGRVAELTSTDVRAALGGVREGAVYDLDAGRFVGMPQWEHHPPFSVTTYRTPRGLRSGGDVDLFSGPGNGAGIGMLTELMVAGMHTGTHLDALCHITDSDGTWYGGFAADEFCGDFGARTADAASIPPILTHGVLLDVAGYLGRPRLEASQAISRTTLARVAAAEGISIPPRACVLVRTGWMSLWPDRHALATDEGAGLDLDAARWLIDDCGAFVVGADTPTVEQIPSSNPDNPHPVHEFALRRRGVHLLENAYLEELARDTVYEFALVCLPLRIEGATASMVRPIAII